MNKVRAISIFIVSIFFVSLNVYCQSTNEVKRVWNNKYELGIGLGEDHSWLGVKGKYNINKSFGIYATLGGEQLSSLVPPSLGVQYNFLFGNSSQWSGFVLSQIGMFRLKIEHLLIPDDYSMIIEKSKRFVDAEIGGGVIFRLSQRYSINFGATYAIYSSRKVDDFYYFFNQEYGTKYTSGVRKVSPILAFNIHY